VHDLLQDFRILLILNDLSFILLNLLVQVDGLIRLMEGDDTGPINIGNPGNKF
jgi:hypothetical protein